MHIVVKVHEFFGRVGMGDRDETAGRGAILGIKLIVQLSQDRELFFILMGYFSFCGIFFVKT